MNWVVLHHADSFRDFYRDNKLVLRKRERTATMVSKGKPTGTPVVQHDLLVPVDGKVVALISLHESAPFSLTMITPCAIYFSTGRAVEKEGDRFFHICIPDQNYYEYVLVSDTKVSIPDHLDYQKTKEANIRLTRKGFVQELAKGSDAAAP